MYKVVLSSPKDVASLQPFYLNRLAFVLSNYISRLYIVGIPATASRLHLSFLSGLEFCSIKQNTNSTILEANSLREYYLRGLANGKMMKYLLSFIQSNTKSPSTGHKSLRDVTPLHPLLI